ncbi:Glycosyl transferase family 11 [Gracilaria domingensis]|nr:Glycosyl transferase family 11 [Gracilaria domingensis]
MISASFCMSSLFIASLLFSGPPWKRKEQKRLIIALSGRLGNQLFQVSASKYISNQFNVDETYFLRNTYSDETDFSRNIFRSLTHINNVKEICEDIDIVQYSQKRMDCSRISIEGAHKCVVLHGLFQCPHMAKEGLPVVRKIIERESVTSKARKKYLEYTENDPKSVVISIHVRRGDYLKKFNKGLLEPLSLDYYRHALKRVPDDGIFLIFSDDPKWCEENVFRVFSGYRKRIITVVQERDPAVALLMMSLSDHFIIANSTFSWWAAYLGQNPKKIVIAPKNWFGPRVKVENQIYPKEWIIV